MIKNFYINNKKILSLSLTKDNDGPIFLIPSFFVLPEKDLTLEVSAKMLSIVFLNFSFNFTIKTILNNVQENTVLSPDFLNKVIDIIYESQKIKLNNKDLLNYINQNIQIKKILKVCGTNLHYLSPIVASLVIDTMNSKQKNTSLELNF